MLEKAILRAQPRPASNSTRVEKQRYAQSPQRGDEPRKC